MGDLVRDVAEPFALISVHALAANNDDRRVRASRATARSASSGSIVWSACVIGGNALVGGFGSGRPRAPLRPSRATSSSSTM